MKLIFQLIIILFCQNLFCQEYHFDGFLEYKDTINDDTRLYFYNENNENHRMIVFSVGKNIIGRIFDIKNKIFHEHKVNNDGNSIKFIYQFSRNWNPKLQEEGFFHQITEKKIDSTTTEVSGLIYRKNKKKVWSKIEVVIKKNENFKNEELINLFTDGIFPNYQSEIISGIPINIKFPYSDLKRNYSLIRKEKINTILTVDNIKIKQYN